MFGRFTGFTGDIRLLRYLLRNAYINTLGGPLRFTEALGGSASVQLILVL